MNFKTISIVMQGNKNYLLKTIRL